MREGVKHPILQRLLYPKSVECGERQNEEFTFVVHKGTLPILREKGKSDLPTSDESTVLLLVFHSENSIVIRYGRQRLHAAGSQTRQKR